MKKDNFRKGISVVEIMITIAILAGLSSVVIFSFSDINKKQALNKSVENVLSIFNEMRSKAMSSQDFSDYGIKLSTSSTISFKGSDFDSGTDMKEYLVSDIVSFGYSISSSSSEIIFKKVTGETEQSGTLDFYLFSNPSHIENIEIYNTGVVEVK